MIDSAGIVQHASSVTPAGKRDIAELAALCEEVEAKSGGAAEAFAKPPGLPVASVLYVKSNCGLSRAALLARDNLHLDDSLEVKNVSENADARAELLKTGGKDQAPCLVTEESALYESQDIIQKLVELAAPAL